MNRGRGSGPCCWWPRQFETIPRQAPESAPGRSVNRRRSSPGKDLSHLSSTSGDEGGECARIGNARVRDFLRCWSQRARRLANSKGHAIALGGDECHDWSTTTQISAASVSRLEHYNESPCEPNPREARWCIRELESTSGNKFDPHLRSHIPRAGDTFASSGHARRVLPACACRSCRTLDRAAHATERPH
jgi:hypothetical protein